MIPSIAPVVKAHWKSICHDCAGSIDSLVELLQGRLAKGVMDRVCREGDGLFPSPGEIKLACSCPDWADMCKHVSAVLYGVGARLDEKPQLLFVLRGVDENELIAAAGQDLPLSRATPGAAKVLNDADVAALFGLEMADTADSGGTDAPKRKRRKVSKTASKQLKRPKPVKLSKPPRDDEVGGAPATSQHDASRGSRSRPEPKSVSLVRAGKRRANRRPHRAA